MGVINVTPDSFTEPLPQLDPSAALERALEMQAAGVDVIDVGGESTRPGAEAVSADEELARVLPIVEHLSGRVTVPLSIDTYKSDVARAAIEAGACIVNDVSGGLYDPALARTTAIYGAALVLTHTRGRSAAMYAEAQYGDVVADVAAELRVRIAAAREAGVPLDRIILDPGIGFAKRPVHSYGLLARLDELATALERPLLVGPSRKSFMRSAVRGVPPAERDWGTAAAVTAAVLNGAHIVRVHAVAGMVQVVRVADAIRDAL